MRICCCAQCSSEAETVKLVVSEVIGVGDASERRGFPHAACATAAASAATGSGGLCG